jgi:hypothetical protein
MTITYEITMGTMPGNVELSRIDYIGAERTSESEEINL